MALYRLQFPMQLGNGKISRWGVDLETAVSLTGTELIDIAETAFTEWKTHAALYAVDQEFHPCEIQGFERVANVPPQDAGWHREPTTVKFVATGALAPGTVAGDSVPPNVALVVTLRTDDPQRRALGRCYTHPPPESLCDGDGAVSDFALRAAMVEECVAAAEGAIAPVDVDHVVYSTKFGTQAEVTEYEANERCDTQRRRLLRV